MGYPHNLDVNKGTHTQSIPITKLGCFSNAASVRKIENDQEATSTEKAGIREDNEKVINLSFGSRMLA